MKWRNTLTAAAGILALAGAGTFVVTASSHERGQATDRRSMHRMGPGHDHAGHGMMGSRFDKATAADVDLIHELLDNHDLIKRTVEKLPDGIRTVTESDDPRVAKYIKDHVQRMGQRVRAGNEMGLPMESPALLAIYRNRDKITTKVETTDKGVVVVQTSGDPAAVAVLQEHAGEVSDLVRGGMRALHSAMMKNGGMGMMHGGMHGRMHGKQQGRTTPDAR
jgi:peptidoglycan/xylan/chitin deacetylase (PgdA/CDA1 family)